MSEKPDCPRCNGIGTIKYESLDGPIGVSVEDICWACNGTGFDEDEAFDEVDSQVEIVSTVCNW